MFLKGDILKAIDISDTFAVVEEISKGEILKITKINKFGVIEEYETASVWWTNKLTDTDKEIFKSIINTLDYFYSEVDKKLIKNYILELDELKNKLIQFIDYPDKFDKNERERLKICIKDL